MLDLCAQKGNLDICVDLEFERLERMSRCFARWRGTWIG